MGLNPISSGSGTSPPNPDPRRFEIIDATLLSPYVCMKVRYLGVTSYEGLKVLVLRESATRRILDTGRLDPHFTRDGDVVARFAPTDDGWRDAVDYCRRKIEEPER